MMAQLVSETESVSERQKKHGAVIKSLFAAIVRIIITFFAVLIKPSKLIFIRFHRL